MDKLIVNPPIYLASTEIDCWKCKSKMTAVAIIAPNIPEAEGEIGILSDVSLLPEYLVEEIQKLHPNYQLRYSNTSKDKYYANTCPNCSVITGDFYLHSEPGGAFFPMSDIETKKIQVRKIELPETMEIEAGYGVGLGDEILKLGEKI